VRVCPWDGCPRDNPRHSGGRVTGHRRLCFRLPHARCARHVGPQRRRGRKDGAMVAEPKAKVAWSPREFEFCRRVHHHLIPPRAVYSPRPHGGSVQSPKRSTGYSPTNLNHPSSQPTQLVIDASPSGATKERSQSYQRPLQAKRVQTIAQTTALTPKRPNRATSTPRAFPSIFHPRIS
jgi:hypothetical protein